MNITIIGAGNVGSTLGQGWISAGHRLTDLVRDPHGPRSAALAAQGAQLATPPLAPDCEVVVLATPWAASEQALAWAGDLAGRVLIDATNPIGAGFTLVAGLTTSGAEQVAGWASGARVVKAFNTIGYGVMAAPVLNGQAAFLPVVGDDGEAKAVAIRLAQDLGFDAHDLGPLASARYTEPFAMLWITLAMQPGFGRGFAFSLIRP
jgi:predicted dinucleotide-binding enzyme